MGKLFMNNPNIVVLLGGISGEREVSFKTAHAVINQLKQHFNVRSIQLDDKTLPEDLIPNNELIFPLLHGTFGEDGSLQALLEQRGLAFIGSDSPASRLCMDKMQSKRLAQALGISVLPAIEVIAGQELSPETLKAQLKCDEFALKPTCEGSSIGVHLCDNFLDLQQHWKEEKSGHYMIERRVHGRELTVGVLQGEALGVVEIRPRSGFYDFHNKYTPGACEYLYPAPIDATVTNAVRDMAARFFAGAHCLDFARADFLLEGEQVFFLEMNTIPGMTDQSLFPKSADCYGLSFDTILQRIVQGAVQRNQIAKLLK